MTPSLLSLPVFRRYLCAALSANLGYRVQLIALGILVYRLTGSPFDLGILSAVIALPAVLCNVLGGVLAGLLLYALGAPLVLRLVPVLALALQLPAAVAVSGAAVVVGLVGALIPLWRVGRIHPAELFRA